MAAEQESSLPLRDTVQSFGTIRTTRRGLLQAAVGSVGAAALHSIDAPRALVHESRREPNYVEQIRAFEAERGPNEPLHIGEIREILSALAQLYVESTGSLKTPEDLLAHTYILFRPENTHQDEYGDSLVEFPRGKKLYSRAIQQFITDYPQCELDYNLAQHLHRLLLDEGSNTTAFAINAQPEPRYDYSSQSIVPYHGIFLFPHLLNNNKLSPEAEEHVYALEFDEPKPITTCNPVKPATQLRNVTHHEWSHYDVESNSGNTQGFTDFDHYGQYALFGAPRLIEEMTADYVSVQISAQYGLPYRTAYSHEPLDYKNFRSMLRQANISLKELCRYHRYSDLETFIFLLAKSAHPTDRMAMASLQRELPDMFYSGEDGHMDWERIEEHFPMVDTREYLYNGPYASHSSSSGVQSGCILPPKRYGYSNR